jgi:Ca2+/Na+ antiporter
MALTMCPMHAGRVGRTHLALLALFSPLFFLFAAGVLPRVALHPASAAVTTAVICCGCVGAFCWCPRGGLDPLKSNLLQAVAFAQGIMWMHLCADEIVGVFQAAGRVAGVRESLLGGTVMAWGASSGDIAGMLAVARGGSTRMAVTASMAGAYTRSLLSST